MEQFKKEFLSNFSENKLEQALNIIFFIGRCQNFAWGRRSGLLTSDIEGDAEIQGYLEQNVIIRQIDRYKHEIYTLNKQEGIKIYEELVQSLRSQENLVQFVAESKSINKKIFSFLGFTDILENDYKNSGNVLAPDLQDSPFIEYVYHNIFSQLDIWEEISLEYKKNYNKFIYLIKKYKLYFDITGFQSNKSNTGRKRILYHPDIKIPYIKAREIFISKFSKSLDLIENLYIPLLESQYEQSGREYLWEFPEKIIKKYLEEIENIISITSSKMITSPIIANLPSLFYVFDPEAFESIMLEKINSIFKPIADFLLEKKT